MIGASLWDDASGSETEAERSENQEINVPFVSLQARVVIRLQ